MIKDECSLCDHNGSGCSGYPMRDEQPNIEELDRMFAWWEAQRK